MENGLCIIGIQQSAMIGPVAVDVVYNVRTLVAYVEFPVKMSLATDHKDYTAAPLSLEPIGSSIAHDP